MFQVELSWFFQVSDRRFKKNNASGTFQAKNFEKEEFGCIHCSKQPMLAEGSFYGVSIASFKDD